MSGSVSLMTMKLFRRRLKRIIVNTLIGLASTTTAASTAVRLRNGPRASILILGFSYAVFLLLRRSMNAMIAVTPKKMAR